MKKIFEKLKIFCVKNHISVILVSLCILLLIAGTAVLMASGATKANEDVYVGDMVKSYNTATGKVESKRVLQTFENETDELVTISTSDGQQITATPGHKFFANNDWVSAEDLRAGDVLVNVNGEKVIVEQVQHEILDSPVKVYNFSVDRNQNYYVSQDLNSEKSQFVIVHNTCKAQGKSHGSDGHKNFIDNMVKDFEKDPNVKEIYVNKALKTAGLKGNQRPDIIVKFASGENLIIEVASPSQLTGTGRQLLNNKISIMELANKGIKSLLF